MRKLLSMIVAAAALVPVVISASVPLASALNPDLLTFTGEAGDFIVGATSHSFAAGQFTVIGGRQVITIQAPDAGSFWNVNLAAPQGGSLGVGFYEDATRYPFNNPGPGLDMSGLGAGCNKLSGRFVIDEITFNPDDSLASLVAHWEQHCENFTAAGFGTISWNGSTPLSPMDAVGANNFPNVPIDSVATAKPQTFTNNGADPVDVTAVALSGTDADQFTISADGCTGTTVPAGGQCDVMVAFAPTQLGKSYAAVSVTVAAPGAPSDLPLRGVATTRASSIWLEGEQGDQLVGPTHRVSSVERMFSPGNHSALVISMPAPRGGSFALTAAGGVPLKAGTYAATEASATPTAHGFEVNVNGVSCFSIAARVIVRQIAFSRDGTVSRFVGSWEIHCNGSAAASFGAVNFNGTVPFTQRTISPLASPFPTLNVGTSVLRAVAVKNNGPAPLHVTSAKLGGTGAAQFVLVNSNCTNVTLAVGASCTSTIRFAPRAAGSHSAKLIIVDDYAPVGGIGSGQDVVLTGRALAGPTAFLEGEDDDSFVGAPHVTLSAVKVTGTRRSITIAGNEGNDTWQVVIFPRAGTTFSTTPVTLATKRYDARDATHAGLSLVWNNLLCRTATGRIAIDQLSFNTNGTVKSITARWEYHCGGEPESSFGGVRANSLATFSVPDLTDRVTWEQVPMNTTGATKPVVLSNRGPSTLPVGKVALQGPDATQFQIVTDGCSNRSVAPGSSCTVTVRFLPGATLGERRARLAIPHAGALMGKGGTGQDVVLLGSATAPLDSNYGELTTVEPARLVDTAAGIGAPKAPLGPASSLLVQVTGQGGVPSTGVSAVIVSVTTRRTSLPGSAITVWAAGQPKPATVFMAPTPGKAIAGLATVRVGTGGKIQLFNTLGSSDVTVDVVGWYSDLTGPDGSRFRPNVIPTRLIDTSTGEGAIPTAPIGAGKSLGIDVQFLAGLLPAGTTAVALNVTVTSASASGNLTLYPNDVARPAVPTIPVNVGTAATNLVVARLPADGVLQIFNSAGNTNVTVDFLGYWIPATGNAGRYVPVTPYRTLDTRTSGGPIAVNDWWQVRIGGELRVAHDAGAVAINVVALAPTAAGSFRVFSDESCDKGPSTTTVVFAAGRTVANATFSALSKKRNCSNFPGLIDIYNISFGTTHALIDVSGYFTP